MTEEDLSRWEELVRVASEGPWTASLQIPGMVLNNDRSWVAHCPHGSAKETEQLARQDAAFIAEARTAVPALCAEVRALWAILGRRQLDRHRCQEFPKGEQCALREGHEGGHKWGSAD